MAQTQKIVHVPDVGVVAFPGDLEDDHVKRLIKSFREKKDQPKITEESEHARQLKPAQPLSTAIPKLPAWANTPLVSDKDLEETPAGQALTAKSQAEFAKAHPKIEATLEKANTPVVLGGLQGVKEFTQGMLTPANMALMLGAPESKILSGIFATQAMRGSYSDAKAAQKAFEAGNNPEAIKYATQALLGLGVGALAGTHTVKDIPVPEPVKAFMADESGFVDPIKTWPQFKQWFGDSKVVDEAGKPKVVFHGTDKEFDEFTRGELGSHFGTAEQANKRLNTSIGKPSTGENIIPAYIRLNNPIRFSSDPGYFGRLSLLDQLMKDKAISESESKELLDQMNESDKRFASTGGANERAERFKVIREYLKSKGYDGIVYPNEYEGKGESYIVFDPTQIKSAIGNSGAFDPKSGSLTDPRAPKLPDVKAKAAELKLSTARTYEAVQKDIDDAEDELEKSGTQVTRLYFPEHADVLSKAEGWKPMPENLVRLYAERDAIGSGQLKQSIGEIKSNLEKAGIKNDAEIRHVLEYYALDPNRTDAAKQYLAAEHTQAMVDQPVKRQLEQAYISLASERGIPMDDEDDLWRDRKTTQDAIAAVKAIHSYFYPGTELNIKGILPEPKSDPLDDIKKKAEEVKARSQKAGPSQ